MDKMDVFLTVMFLAGLVAQVYFIFYSIKNGPSRYTTYNTMVWTTFTWVVLGIQSLYEGNYVWFIVDVVLLIIFFDLDYRNYKRF